jgi:hypothetical protein
MPLISDGTDPSAHTIASHGAIADSAVSSRATRAEGPRSGSARSMLGVWSAAQAPVWRVRAKKPLTRRHPSTAASTR